LFVRLAARLTSGILLLLALLHVAWGCGSAAPFRTRGDLADAVVGTTEVPSPRACFLVAGALSAGSMLTAGVAVAPRLLRRMALVAMAGILSVRGVLGLSGKTALISPGSDSARFVRLDRNVYGPLCVALSVGSLVALTQSSSRPRGHPIEGPQKSRSLRSSK
jgi:hypothetical protein